MCPEATRGCTDEENAPNSWSSKLVPDSLRHDERAVWAHLEPVLKDMKEKKPSLTTVHILSDDPVTQKKKVTLGPVTR
ncbi:hypothetical protein AAFF_G00392550 [Aldrovandia affinis]|uniref:Uncharacterized protein n=1 Tax=Aldrovandia affinis TaxID=143900 RepID=A0AAD7WL10_9TELE|nr:hypothetical protein AAFF_G00392550 [Aldrovandia affinis]